MHIERADFTYCTAEIKYIVKQLLSKKNIYTYSKGEGGEGRRMGREEGEEEVGGGGEEEGWRLPGPTVTLELTAFELKCKYLHFGPQLLSLHTHGLFLISSFKSFVVYFCSCSFARFFLQSIFFD